MDKRQSRLRRARKPRSKIRSLGMHRLSVHRTPRHIYAQVFTPGGDQVVAAASTLDAGIKKGLSGTGNVAAAEAVGKAIAEKAIKAGVESLAFDRSGFRYHGRVKALADAAREGGLKF